MKPGPIVIFTNQPPTSNYLRKLAAHAGKLDGAAGQMRMDVFHDAWCAAVAGSGPCNCSPDITLRPLAREVRR